MTLTFDPLSHQMMASSICATLHHGGQRHRAGSLNIFPPPNLAATMTWSIQKRWHLCDVLCNNRREINHLSLHISVPSGYVIFYLQSWSIQLTTHFVATLPFDPPEITNSSLPSPSWNIVLRRNESRVSHTIRKHNALRQLWPRHILYTALTTGVYCYVVCRSRQRGAAPSVNMQQASKLVLVTTMISSTYKCNLL